MMGNNNKALISIFILIIFTLNGTIINSESFSKELVKGIETTGGSTIILDEYTATWCQVCAEIDPEIKDLALMHNERVALIALHPADGVDDLGNYASSKRINQLFNNSPSIQAPTFLLDGKMAMEGANEINMLNSKIMQTQSKKSNFTEIYFSAKRINNSIHFEMHLDSELTGSANIMITENEVVSNNHIGELNKFDNVLIEMISIDLMNKTIISGNNEWDFITNQSENKTIILATHNIKGNVNFENFGFLATHEIQNENITSVLGAVKIVQGDLSKEENILYISIFIMIFSLGVFAALGKINSDPKNEENE
ncbi:MAG: hypothetical protein CMB48_00320 [Euryarchaeota archaeon]|nr:hypothetical protein [Euryarchaeota archaeon]|tara:strand:+ start:10683 stop:11618 length:936 start_codon:yes stop_codon:yes gene_type:complete